LPIYIYFWWPKQNKKIKVKYRIICHTHDDTPPTSPHLHHAAIIYVIYSHTRIIIHDLHSSLKISVLYTRGIFAYSQQYNPQSLIFHIYRVISWRGFIQASGYNAGSGSCAPLIPAVAAGKLALLSNTHTYIRIFVLSCLLLGFVCARIKIRKRFFARYLCKHPLLFNRQTTFPLPLTCVAYTPTDHRHTTTATHVIVSPTPCACVVRVYARVLVPPIPQNLYVHIRTHHHTPALLDCNLIPLNIDDCNIV